MSKKKAKEKKVRYRNFSFRCSVTDDKDLIDQLDKSSENERSADIRKMLRKAANIPDKPKAETLDRQILRKELAAVVQTILSNIQATPTTAPAPVAAMPRHDVNDNGRRIPDF